MAMVVRANKHTNVGGHIASFASAATLYDVGLQPLLACAVGRARRRPGVRAGPFGARRVCTRSHARPLHRRADGQLPPGGRRQGRLLVSASVADAGVLAVSDGIDGARTADGDLPGALHEVSAGPGPGEDRGPQGLVLLRRRRNGRARIDGRDRHGGARDARQPDLRHQLQPAAARRSGARQRQDHPGARGRIPRRRLERDQGHLGLALGCAARARQAGHSDAPDDGMRRRRVPDVQIEGRRVRARIFLQHARAQGAGGRLFRRGHLEPESRRARSAQGLRRLPGGGRPQGAADGHSRQDDQGLRHGRVRRGAEHHAPAEENVGRLDQALSRSLPDSGARRQARAKSLTSSSRRDRPKPST